MAYFSNLFLALFVVCKNGVLPSKKFEIALEGMGKEYKIMPLAANRVWHLAIANAL